MQRTPGLTLILAVTLALDAIRCARSQESADEKALPLVGMVSLIVREPVLRELGIENDSPELAEIRQVLKPFSTVLQQRLNRPDDNRSLVRPNPQQLYAVVEAEFVAELQQRLKPEQFTRLQQIHWQRWGIIAIEDPELARQLELSPEQQEQLATVRRQIKTRRSELNQQRIEAPKQGGDLDEIKRKLRELDADQIRDYQQLLTPVQSEQFSRLKGVPFELLPIESPPANPAVLPTRTRPGGLMALALLPPVLEELKLDPVSPEVQKIQQLSRAHSQELRQQLPSRVSTAEERERVREIESTLQGKYDLELKTLLTPTQRARLRQIDWQRQGIEGLSHPEVVKTLKINPQQQAELAALNREIFKTVRGLLNPAGKDRPVSNTVDEILRRKVQELVREKEAKVQQILTKKQQQEWQEIQGPPFDLTLIRTRVGSPMSPNPGQ